MYFRNSMYPSVPSIVSRPSPHVRRPSGEYQSTRRYPCAVPDRSTIPPKSRKTGCSGLARFAAIENPVRPRGRPQPVWSQTQRLHDFSDRACGNGFAGAGYGGNLETFREIDGPDAAGLGCRKPQTLQIGERGAPGLVRQNVLAVPHRINRKRCARGRSRGNHNRIDPGSSRIAWRSVTRGTPGCAARKSSSVSGVPSVHYPANSAPAAIRWRQFQRRGNDRDRSRQIERDSSWVTQPCFGISISAILEITSATFA